MLENLKLVAKHKGKDCNIITSVVVFLQISQKLQFKDYFYIKF